MQDPRELLVEARAGNAAALGELMERYRPYLRLLAQRRVDGRLRARIDPSDIVQRTYLEAHRDLAKFRGDCEAEWRAWLRTILDHNALTMIETHLVSQKRSARREQRIDDADDHGESFARQIESDQSSPSQRAMRGETAVELACALDALPEDQREAVRLRHLEGWPLVRIAEQLQRSEVAAAGLLKRGLRRLRIVFQEGR